MAHDKTAVRNIIDKVKAEGRTSLTAPEGKLVCDAYGIPVPQEGVAKTAAEAAKLASGMGFHVVLQGGQEVIIGAVTDPSFGKLVAFGLGGVLVEVLKDATFRLAPATKDDALSMLDGIQAAQMLKGVRGGDPVNRDALATLIEKVSQLI